MFVNPMWQDEVQRIGKARCTPLGYRLHGLSDLIGIIATLLLLAVPCYLGYRALRGTFEWKSLLLLLAPIGIAIAGNILHSYSWHLADAREFKYDYKSRISTWRDDAGELQTFTYDDYRKSSADNSKNADD